MKILNRVSGALIALAVAAGAIPVRTAHAESASLTRDVVIDGSKANTNENMLYRGNGMVSANNSSRLLLDYKEKSPDAYKELLEYLFGEKGLHISHLKLEMGADINSSSGTEPAVKRTEDEPADVTRGAGYQLAHDAKEVNPDLTLDMLYWSVPKWVSDAKDQYAAQYKWYKETLDAAYETYGLEFDYVSCTQNERQYDTDWIKYLSSHLKAEKDTPYDYSKIKIVAGDEVCTWNIAEEMINDKELRDAVDVIGSHYTSSSPESAQKLASEYGKELWFSEGSSPMEYAQGTYSYDCKKTGLSEINGVLDIANRFISMYPNGKMTLYEYQPAVASYYSGATYTQKQLILAQEPWSGYYELDPGYFMGLHFSQFYKKGWAFIDDACYGDGQAGGDGHAIVDATYTYMTATDTQTGDYSTTITNTTDSVITYNFTVKNLKKLEDKLNVYITGAPDINSDDGYDSNYFRHCEEITPDSDGQTSTFSVTVAPGSMVTVSTIKLNSEDYAAARDKLSRHSELLGLPYFDNYEYDDEFLKKRGSAPLYTTDEGGAFEVTDIDGNKVLMQKITENLRAREWGGNHRPVTNFGDDRWFNYSISANVSICKSDDPDKNFAGIGLRYNLADAGNSGYIFTVSESGTWTLCMNREELASGKIDNFAPAKNTLKLEAENRTVRAYICDTQLADITLPEDKAVMSAGRAAFYSSYNNNYFDDLSIEPIGDEYYTERIDQTDKEVTYSGSWEHICMSGFKNYRRTNSTGSEGAELSFSYEGTGFILVGENGDSAELEITVDNEKKTITSAKSGARETGCMITGLENKKHNVSITINKGSLSLDAIEFIKSSAAAENDESITDSTSESDSKNNSKIPKGALIAAGAGLAAAITGAAIYLKKRKK